MTSHVTERVVRSGAELRRAYGGGSTPLASYLAITAGYVGTVAALLGVARRTGRRLPDRVSAGDVVLLSAATFRLSRLITKDAVTSTLRSPFTRFQEAAGEGEVNERPRGHGLRHATGELVSCPFCASVWTVTGLTAGLAFAPRLTRWVAAGASSLAASDFLQLAYARMRHVANAE
ncbi:MAG: DUF1360 domain-containing protein [Micromonosporaceae bacterium]